MQNTQVMFPGAPPPAPMATTTVNAVRAQLAAPGGMLQAMTALTPTRAAARTAAAATSTSA